MRRLAVIGGGEHARVVIETARTCPGSWQVDGFIDPRPCEETRDRLGVSWLGDDDAALADLDRWYVLGVGEVGIGNRRRTIVDRYVAAGASFATIVHACAWISPTARLGEGTVVLANAVVQTGAVIGRHALVGTSTVIEHDVELGAFAQTGPGVLTGGGAKIGEDSYLGLGAAIRDHVTIGARVMVAMGAVVTATVSDGACVAGVPARRLP